MSEQEDNMEENSPSDEDISSTSTSSCRQDASGKCNSSDLVLTVIHGSIINSRMLLTFSLSITYIQIIMAVMFS